MIKYKTLAQMKLKRTAEKENGAGEKVEKSALAMDTAKPRE